MRRSRPIQDCQCMSVTAIQTGGWVSPNFLRVKFYNFALKSDQSDHCSLLIALHQEDDALLGVTWPWQPCHHMSPCVIQTRQLPQLCWNWPKEEIKSNSTSLANFNSVGHIRSFLGRFLLSLAKAVEAVKETMSAKLANFASKDHSINVMGSILIEQ